MDCFQRTAQILNLSLEELVTHVVHGRMTFDPDTEKKVVTSILERYEAYRTLPAYLANYCEVVVRTVNQRGKAWSLAEAEGVANGNP